MFKKLLDKMTFMVCMMLTIQILCNVFMQYTYPAYANNSVKRMDYTDTDIVNDDMCILKIEDTIDNDEPDYCPRYSIVQEGFDQLREEYEREQEELARQKEEAERLEMERRTISNIDDEEVISPYNGYITKYMDLSKRTEITADEMNDIIDKYLQLNGCNENSELHNMGSAFIEASNITGYDPIFLLALAAHESGWDVSELHVSKNNPYSIHMIDSNPNLGYTLGDSFYEGIINGAIWIRENYYDNGHTTLYNMIYNGRQYASTTDHWIDGICSIMDASYKFIK